MSSPPRPPFQSPIPAAMAAPAPLTVRLPPLQEDAEATPCLADQPHGPAPAEIAPASNMPHAAPADPICEMCGIAYEDRGDGQPFCGYWCASGGGSHAPAPSAPPACYHDCGTGMYVPGQCLDPEHCECACADCRYARLPLCYSCGHRDASAADSGSCADCAANPSCGGCGVRVPAAGEICKRCKEEADAEERWMNETCRGCSLKNYECRCGEDDYDDRGDDSPCGRRCPVCGCHFEGNEWFGVCSRSCARPRGWG